MESGGWFCSSIIKGEEMEEAHRQKVWRDGHISRDEMLTSQHDAHLDACMGSDHA